MLGYIYCTAQKLSDILRCTYLCTCVRTAYITCRTCTLTVFVSNLTKCKIVRHFEVQVFVCAYIHVHVLCRLHIACMYVCASIDKGKQSYSKLSKLVLKF